MSDKMDINIQDDNITMDDVMASMDNQEQEIVRGRSIEGTVVRVDKDGIMVDIGAKSEAKIPVEELSLKERENLEENFKIGDSIKARVLQPSSKEGIILSKKSLDYELRWDDIQNLFDSKEIVTAVVKEANKGGLRVDLLGYSAFCPNSQVWGKPEKDNGDDANAVPYAKKVGETLCFEIKEIDKDKHKIILSNRDYERKKRENEKKIFWNDIAEGQIRDGIVKSITGYGAFIDLSGELEGNFDGMLHISEMSWNKVNSPKDILKVNDKIQVYVLSADPKTSRISLSLKQIQPDPWENIPSSYPEGKIFTGKITRVAQKAAFVDLGSGFEGIIPISEMSTQRINTCKEKVSEGDEVTVKVISLSEKERKVALSIKEIELDKIDAEESKVYEEIQKEEDEASSFNLGDMLPDNLKLD